MAEMPRLKKKYNEELKGQLAEQLSIENVNEIPRLVKIVCNMGVGEAAGDAKILEHAMDDMRTITGQQPAVTRAKKSIAGCCPVIVRMSSIAWSRIFASPAASPTPMLQTIFTRRGISLTFWMESCSASWPLSSSLYFFLSLGISAIWFPFSAPQDYRPWGCSYGRIPLL